MGVEAVQNLHNLIDSDPASCVNTTQLLPFSGIYMTSLNFSNPNNHGSISLNITFDSKLNCSEREVNLELNEHFAEFRNLSAFIGNTLIYFFVQVIFKILPHNCRSIRSCTLKTPDSVLTSSCEYQCQCNQTGCDVIYLDSHDSYKKQPGDACGL